MLSMIFLQCAAIWNLYESVHMSKYARQSDILYVHIKTAGNDCNSFLVNSP